MDQKVVGSIPTGLPILDRDVAVSNQAPFKTSYLGL